MKKEQLALQNIGDNLDQLMNLDPRGYGVCRILYEGSRTLAGEPTTMHAAKGFLEAVKKGDMVFILTGFILRPHLVPEMDGIIGALFLAKALSDGLGLKPVIICPEDNVIAVKNCAPVIGLHLYEDLERMMELPMSMGVIPFTKDKEEAKKQTKEILAKWSPSAVISTEAPGENAVGHYHNAVGVNITELEAKMDVLFESLQKKGIFNMAVGDLGNEIGMGAIGEHILKYIPYTGKGECKCECGGGILARTKADYLITATCSDWGVYGFICALAYLTKNISMVHDTEMEAEVMKTASRSGMIDMTGSLLPGVDGFNISMNATILSLMRQCTEYGIQYENEAWFSNTLSKQFFQERAESDGEGQIWEIA